MHVLTYIAKRLLQAVFVVWAAYTVAFFVLYALPSDPVALIVGPDVANFTPEQLDDLRAEYGLDAPLIVQYFERLLGLLTGDLGTSFATGRPVADMVGEAFWPTAQIASLGLLFAVLGGGGVAIAANATRSRALANALLALPPLGVAIPGFWLGLLLIQWLSFGVPLFPATGDLTPAALVLPAITLAVPTGAMLAQLLSKSLTTTLREPYIDTALAKGADRKRVLFGHALKNASLPAFTMLGLIVGQLLGGAVVTETVFSRPGIGRIAASAVETQDIPVVLGVVLLAAWAFALTNLLVDLVYPLLDPRIVNGGRKSQLAQTAASGASPDADASASADSPRPGTVREGTSA